MSRVHRSLAAKKKECYSKCNAHFTKHSEAIRLKRSSKEYKNAQRRRYYHANKAAISAARKARRQEKAGKGMV